MPEPKRITADLIRKVREESGAPMMRAKKVLEENGGDIKKAVEILKKEGFAKMEKRTDRATSQGLLAVYKHHNGRVAAFVELFCETDFVAKNEMFIELADNLAMQVASMEPKDTKELEDMDFIKDPKKKIGDLVKEVKMKTGENIKIGKILRVELGK